MRLRKIVLTFGLLAALSAPAMAQVKFERKFQEGSTRTAEQVTRVEQKLTIALAICHRLYVMGHGRIVFEGNPRELRANDAVRKEWLEV